MSVYVALRLPLPGGVVTWLVTGSGTTSAGRNGTMGSAVVNPAPIMWPPSSSPDHAPYSHPAVVDMKIRVLRRDRLNYLTREYGQAK